MPRPSRAALYLRVSTDSQTVENQRIALEAIAAQRGWKVTATYADEGISGAKGRNKRPGLDAMLKDATRGKFDVVLVWAIDRLGRSLVDLLHTASTLEASHVDLVLHQQAIDTTTPMGRCFFQVTGAFAEFERGMIRDRVKAGLVRAKARLEKHGRKLGRPRISNDIETKIRQHLSTGAGILKVAKAVGVSNTTVSRVKQEMVGSGKASATPSGLPARP